MRRFSLLFLVAAVCCGPSAVWADTLTSALSAAYRNNPSLNAARADLRATDEGVPQARANLRPFVSGSTQYGYSYSRTESSGLTTESHSDPLTFNLSVSQNVFTGFQTRNAIRGAESAVLGGRQDLIQAEQVILLDAATAYMDVVRDQALVELNQQNVEVLREELRSTRDRFEVGEVTRTDVAQAESRVSEGIGNLRTAEGNLASSRATYQDIIGKMPGQLVFPHALGFTTPPTLESALGTAAAQHPAILSAKHGVETAEYNIKELTGQLLPTLTVEATASRTYDVSDTIDDSEAFEITGNLNIPLYQQGLVSSQVRQAKHQRTSAQLSLDDARRQIRSDVTSSWATLEATKGEILADVAQIKAAELALEGVREEERVGQRTTLDVLDAQQEVLDARTNLVSSQRDRVVAAFSLMSAMGQLTAAKLRLPVQIYDPTVNYEAVRDKWFGLRTGQGN